MLSPEFDSVLFEKCHSISETVFLKRIFNFCNNFSQSFQKWRKSLKKCLFSHVIYLLLFVICFAVYWPSLAGDFVFDDRPAILDNKYVNGHRTDLVGIFSNDYWGTPVKSVSYSCMHL